MLRVDFDEFVTCLSDALHLVYVGAGLEWGGMTHSSKVCYLACRVAEQMHLDARAVSDLYYAALLHDLGVSSTEQLKDLMKHEFMEDFSHCKRGHDLLKKSTHTERFADTVLHHHNRWAGPNDSGISGNDIPVSSRIICVANYVDVIMKPRKYIHSQRDKISKALGGHSDAYFDPQIVEAFNQATGQDLFWFDLTARGAEELLYHYRPKVKIMLEYDELEAVAGVFAHVVDSKSKFTAQHSRRVARIAVALARRLKFSQFDCEQMNIAGLLHDVGKLSIPDEIFDKPDKLTVDEYEIIRRYKYFTHVILRKIDGFKNIADWASLHHDRLDRKGYPFRIKAETLSVGALIMAVSDTFVALAEDRPYRKSYSVERICEILKEHAQEGELDSDIVKILTGNIDEFYAQLEVEQPTS